MKIHDLLAREGDCISFEFFPPTTEEGEDRLFETIARLDPLRPGYVSVTYGAGGSTARNTHRIVKRIKDTTSMTPMPHLTCMDQSREDLRTILGEYRDEGIENVLALRGDPPQEAGVKLPEDRFCYAKELVSLAASFNAFSISVAVYPEGHCDAPDLQTDMKYTVEKINAGADFAITQMFFENRYFFAFMDRAEKAGIDIPVVPGIMPITDMTRIMRFAELCGATLPLSLIERMENSASLEEVKKIGVDYATRQCEELWSAGFRYLHFYTLNKSEAVIDVLHNLGLAGRV